MSDTILEFTIPGLPKIINANSNWRVRYGHAKTWRKKSAEAAWAMWQKSKRCGKPLTHVKLTLIRGSTREPDFDNLVASFKPVVDGLMDAGVISDDNSKVVLQRAYKWEKAAKKAGFIRVTVESLE
jgi:Holliday junction resolvase RusA-like endonuclease